jgi:adenylate cyclase
MQISRDARLKAIFFLAVAVATSGCALLLYGFGVLNDIERQTIDARFSVRGTQPRNDVVVVGIDAASLNRLKAAFPFRRRIYAPLLDNLRRAGARTIAFDIEFDNPTNPNDDLALYEAIGRAHGKVALATSEVGPDGSTNVFGGAKNLARVGARVGASQLPNDRYAVLRRMRYSTLGLENFAIVAAETARGEKIKPSQLGGSTAWIDYAGPPNTIPVVPFWRVWRGVFASNRVRDKVVLVGATEPRLGDVHATPTSGSSLMAGAEVQANQIWTALHDFPLKSTPSALNIALTLLLAFAIPLVSIFRSARVTGAAVVAVGGAFLVATQLAFNHGVVLSFVYPLTALVLGWASSLGLKGVLTAVERQHVRDLFARFVPEQVVDEVLARTDGDLRLGGNELVATVMFCDLRGFTSSVEQLPADKVIELLNHYLESMTETVLSHGGTVVSYMGDGIMALFGAPIELPDHADRAFASACEMVTECLPRFNAWLREACPCDAFDMGIGLHTGPVMSGNVGSAKRLEYTAVGDTVNTASRLEGMTKGTEYSIFISDSTCALLSADKTVGLVDSGEHEIRGRNAKLKVWAVPAAPTLVEPSHADAEAVDATARIQPI